MLPISEAHLQEWLVGAHFVPVETLSVEFFDLKHWALSGSLGLATPRQMGKAGATGETSRIFTGKNKGNGQRQQRKLVLKSFFGWPNL